MKRRVFLVLELSDHSQFDSTSDQDLDDLAEDALLIAHGVRSAVAFATWEDLELEEGPGSGRD
jgi:hypothetical protein